jgi:type VI secretion system protein ImpH
MPDLIRELLIEPYKFSLLQSINILERYSESFKCIDLNDKKRLLEFKAHVSMAFPSADVHEISNDGEHSPRFKLYTPIICLAGSTGPLPKIFTELFLESRKNKDNGPLDFLDIFNHRLIQLFFSQKTKYHLALGNNEISDIPILQFLNAVSSSGINQANLDKNHHPVWLRHSGLQGPAPRSIQGLMKILYDHLGIEFNPEQFYGAWLDLDPSEYASLGSKTSSRNKTILGSNSSLGTRFWDQSAGFLLRTFNLSFEMFNSLLPMNDNNNKLTWVIQRHQSSPRKVCLELQLDSKKYKPLLLGKQQGPILGLSSWIIGPIVNSSNSTNKPVKLEPCRFWLKNQDFSTNTLEI